MNNFPRYTQLRSKDICLDIVGRFLGVFTLACPFIWFYGLNAIGAGNKIFAAIYVLTLTIMGTVSLFLVTKGLYKLIHFYTKNTGVLRIIICLLALYIPYLEIRYIKDKNKDIIVPALIQPKVGDTSTLVSSFLVFIFGVPVLSSLKLAEELKEKDFFTISEEEGDHTLVINTNMGAIICSYTAAEIYLFKELEANEWYDLPEECGWSIEESEDKTASAVVCEKSFDPFFDTEKEIASQIVDALKKLEEFHQKN